MIKSKKYVDASKLYDKTAAYEATEAVALVKKMASAKFDETVEAQITKALKQIRKFLGTQYQYLF